MLLAFIICTVACVLQSARGAPAYTPHSRRSGLGGPDGLGGTRGFGSSIRSLQRTENNFNRVAGAGFPKQDEVVKSGDSGRTENKRFTGRPKILGSNSGDTVGVGDGPISDTINLKSGQRELNGIRSGGSRSTMNHQQQFQRSGTIRLSDGGHIKSSLMDIGESGGFIGTGKAIQLINNVQRYNRGDSLPSKAFGSGGVGGVGRSGSSHIRIGGSERFGGGSKSGQNVSDVQRYNGVDSVPPLGFGTGGVGSGGRNGSRHMGTVGNRDVTGASESGQFISNNDERYNVGHSRPPKGFNSDGIGGVSRGGSSHIDAVRIDGLRSGVSVDRKSDNSIGGFDRYHRGGTRRSKGFLRESGSGSWHMVTSGARIGNHMGSYDTSVHINSGDPRATKDFRGDLNNGESFLSSSIRLPGIDGGPGSFGVTKASHTSESSRSTSDVLGGQNGRVADSGGPTSRRRLGQARGTSLKDYFGGKRGLNGLPILRGTGADRQYADESVSVGMGDGYGIGSRRAYNEGIRSGRRGMSTTEQQRRGIPIESAAQYTSMDGHVDMGGRRYGLFNYQFPYSESSGNMHRELVPFGIGRKFLRGAGMFENSIESYPGSIGYGMYGMGHNSGGVSSVGSDKQYMNRMPSHGVRYGISRSGKTGTSVESTRTYPGRMHRI